MIIVVCCNADDFGTMKDFIGSALSSLVASHPAAQVGHARILMSMRSVTHGCVQMLCVTRCVHKLHVVVTQVGILQFSNDVRVEMPPQAVDHQVYQKTLQTMVSNRGQVVLHQCVHVVLHCNLCHDLAT